MKPQAPSPFLTVTETAEFLRTTPKAIYTRIARNQLPGVVRDGTRVLVKRSVLERSLDETASATPGK